MERKKSQHLATWLFGSVSFIFLIGVFIFAPNELPSYKHRILALLSAYMVGLFAFFLTGRIKISTNCNTGNFIIQAGGGIALFVLVLFSWPTDYDKTKPIEELNSHGNVVNQNDEKDEFTKKIRSRKLIKKLKDAQSYINGGSRNGYEKAIELYRDVLNQLPFSDLKNLNQDLLAKAKKADKDGYKDQAANIYNALFSEYLKEP